MIGLPAPAHSADSRDNAMQMHAARATEQAQKMVEATSPAGFQWRVLPS